MSICSKCNNNNSQESKFCSQCGTNLNSEKTSAEQFKQEANPNESNPIAIVGLVLAFFIQILGLIFSCIGLNISKQMKVCWWWSSISGNFRVYFYDNYDVFLNYCYSFSNKIEKLFDF